LALRLNITSHNESETIALAEKLAALFRPGDLVILKGELGTGKTVFVRGLAGALGLDREAVNSPSFTIVNEYPGERPMYHLDLYRINDPTELDEIGWDEYLQRPGLIVVEWGDKAGNYLPSQYYVISFKIIDEQTREIDVSHVQS
jgi:tRNA threonylcarbamoyladenosine biosynthesis protein TsaE